MTTIHRPCPSSPFIAAIALLVITPLAMATTACSVLQRFSFAEPTVKLESITVTGLSLSGGSLRLRLDLEGTRFGQVSRDAPLSLPAEAHSPVDVDLRFTWAGVGAAARSIISRGAVNYELRGRILVDTPIDDRWVEIGTTGEARVEDLLN